MKLTKENLTREMNDLSQTVPEVAKKFGLNKNNIYDKLKEWDIPLRGRGRKQTYLANDKAFSKWSHKMAYCLGFIAADGHIWKDRPYLTIGIHQGDIKVLEYIRDYISPESQVRNNKTKTQVQLYIKSQQIWDDLNRFGINNDKTFNLKIDFKIPKKYIGDFVRGYFDGDGSIWKARKNPDYYTGSIVSASKQFLLDLQKLIGFGNVRETHKGKYFSLDFSQSNLIKLKELIYSDPTKVILNRKYNKFTKINHIDRTWSQEEDDLLLEHLNIKIKEITHLFPNRSDKTIQARKNVLRKKYGKNKKHYTSW